MTPLLKQSCGLITHLNVLSRHLRDASETFVCLVSLCHIGWQWLRRSWWIARRDGDEAATQAVCAASRSSPKHRIFTSGGACQDCKVGILDLLLAIRLGSATCSIS